MFLESLLPGPILTYDFINKFTFNLHRKSKVSFLGFIIVKSPKKGIKAWLKIAPRYSEWRPLRSLSIQVDRIIKIIGVHSITTSRYASA